MSFEYMSQEYQFNVNEIYSSIQGEGSRIGLPFTFVRMQGCSLRCSWCDTPYALDKREKVLEMTSNSIVEKVIEYSNELVMLTGGEPLEQKNIDSLINSLHLNGFTVVVETGGHIDIDRSGENAIRIMDIKCPDSSMHKKNKFDNILKLKSADEVKFVVASRLDFDYTKDIIKRYNLDKIVSNILISPAYDKIQYSDLVNWIIEEKLPVRFQIQIHKHIWDPMKKGV